MTTKAHNAKVNAERGAMDLVKLIEQFADEDRCRTYLEQLRWPEGVRCPRCEGDKVKAIQSVTYYRRDTADGKHKKGDESGKRSQFDCSCGYQFSVKSGTVLQDSHLPLWKWFLATYLMCESKKGMSANQLKRTLNVSYEAAWFLCHRIRSAMIGDGEPLSGTVEADETYVGGKLTGFSNRQDGAIHRRDNKTVVLGAIERGGKLRVRVAPNAGHKAIHGFLGDVVDDDADAIYTDSHRSYIGVGDENTRHEFVNHSADEWVRGDVHTNTIESAWSLFDRAVIGSYHKLSKKHMAAYLQEFEFRFNNRDNPFLFRDTLIALLQSDTLTYDDLVR